MMKLDPVKSSHVEAAGWDNGKMRVRFVGGREYEHTATEDEYKALIAAKSIGGAYAKQWRGKDGFTAISAEPPKDSI